MRPRDRKRKGGLILRDHRTSVVHDECRQAPWVMGIVEGRGPGKAWEFQHLTRGDLQCSSVWMPGQRLHAGWAYCWPVVVDGHGLDLSALSQDLILPSRPLLLPAFDRQWTPDEAFLRDFGALPEWASIHPSGWPGLAVAGTKRSSQERVWSPALAGIVAVRMGGEARGLHGTAFLDVTPDGEVDPRYRALAQTHVVVLRPIRPGPYADRGSLAWQLGRDVEGVEGLGLGIAPSAVDLIQPPEETTTGGDEETVERSPDEVTVFGPDSGEETVERGAEPPTTAAPGPQTAAFFSARGGGPCEVANETCQHERGRTHDAERINAGHLHPDTLYFGRGYDGPLDFENGPWPEGVQNLQGTPHVCHIRWDPGMVHAAPDGVPGVGKARIYVNLPIVEQPPPPKPPPPETEETTTGQKTPALLPARMERDQPVQKARAINTYRAWVFDEVSFRPTPRGGGRDLRHEEAVTKRDIVEYLKRPIGPKLIPWGHELGDGDFDQATDEDPRQDCPGPDQGGNVSGGLLLCPGNLGIEDAPTWSPVGRTLKTVALDLLPGQAGIRWGLPDPENQVMKSGFQLDLASAGGAWQLKVLSSAGAATLRIHLAAADDALLLRREASGVDTRVGSEVGTWGDGRDGSLSLSGDTTTASGTYYWDRVEQNGYDLEPTESEYGWLDGYVADYWDPGVGGRFTCAGHGQAGTSGGTGGVASTSTAPTAGGTPSDPGGLTISFAGGSGGGGGGDNQDDGAAGGDSTNRNSKILDGGGGQTGGAGGTSSGNGSAGSNATALGTAYTRAFTSWEARGALRSGFGGGGTGGGGGGESTSEDARDGGAGAAGGNGGAPCGLHARRAVTSRASSRILSTGLDGDAIIKGLPDGGGGGGSGGGAGAQASVDFGEVDQAVTSEADALVQFSTGLQIDARGGSGSSGATGGTSNGAAGGDGEDGHVRLRIWGTVT